jgi:hypothetical protein
MAILSEITELLRRWDVWKRVEAAPQRIDELESRIAALERGLASLSNQPKLPQGRICPICHGELKVIKELEHPEFGFAGVKIHMMKCSKCDYAGERNFSPGKGYE